MKVLRSIREMRDYRSNAGLVGFVPTMGALHDGHLHLMSEAVNSCDTAIGSIYVNPLQFGANEDLSKYPRQEAEDISKAAAVGISAMFCPGGEEMVGGNSTSIEVSGVSDLFEGERRPGHFNGVATIVAKLFGIVEPDVAFFGLKDLQQCAVIRQMVVDLSMPVDLRFVETVREPSGLAMSSRNAYFSRDEKLNAAQLHRCLTRLREQLLMSGVDEQAILRGGDLALRSFGFDVEYLELVDPVTMRRVGRSKGDSRIVVAARYCGVRLIDNIAVNS